MALLEFKQGDLSQNDLPQIEHYYVECVSLSHRAAMP